MCFWLILYFFYGFRNKKLTVDTICRKLEQIYKYQAIGVREVIMIINLNERLIKN